MGHAAVIGKVFQQKHYNKNAGLEQLETLKYYSIMKQNCM